MPNNAPEIVWHSKVRGLMRLLLYRGWRDMVGLGIENRVRAEFPSLVVEQYADIASLVFRLKQVGRADTLGVLLIPPVAADLRDLVARTALFHDLKVLVVLPGCDTATVADGHRLKPSLMIFKDGEPASVCAVIERLFERRLSDVA